MCCVLHYPLTVEGSVGNMRRNDILHVRNEKPDGYTLFGCSICTSMRFPRDGNRHRLATQSIGVWLCTASQIAYHITLTGGKYGETMGTKTLKYVRYHLGNMYALYVLYAM